MKVEKEDFDWAVREGIISFDQGECLWQALEKRQVESSLASLAEDRRPRFDFANVAYYFGALIVISAMAWFITLAWESFGGAGIFTIALIYSFCFVIAGRTLYFRQRLIVPGGLLFVIAVCMTPLAIYGLQRWTGFWLQGDPGVYQDFHVWIKGSWFLMELGTVIAGLVALRCVRFPFLTAPIAFSLWYMSMDITPLLYGENNFNWHQRLLVSLWFGIACLVVAYLVDLRTKRSRGDYAYWLYLFGLLSFWFGLTLSGGGNEWDRFIYCLINLGLMFLSVVLKRRTFMVFGSIGVFSYISYLAYEVFANSLLFPFALSALGIAIIGVGVFYQRYYQKLESLVEEFIPEAFQQLLPRER